MGTGPVTSGNRYPAEDPSIALDHRLKKALLAIGAGFVVYFATLLFLAR